MGTFSQVRLPIPLRLLLAAQPKLATPVLQVVHRVITRHLIGQACLKVDEADNGSVTLIQPSLWMKGSAANLNIHLHCLVLDGVYRRDTEGEPVFVEVPRPTDEALQAVMQKIITRLMKLLTRKGVLIEEHGQTYMADDDSDSDETRTLRPLQATACTCRIAFGPRAGQKVLTLQGATPLTAPDSSGVRVTLLCEVSGPPLREPWRSRTQRQAARAGGAAVVPQ